MKRLAFIGTNEGNGHIFSWSAIVNGRYDKERMKNCGYPVIPEYLGKEPPENLGIIGAQVSYVWTEDRNYAEYVAKTSYIETVLDNPSDAIGKADGVVITTDIGTSHLKLAKPFIEAGIPVFIDKPLTDNEKDLKEFLKYFRENRTVLSSSSYRYSGDIQEFNRTNTARIEFVNCLMSKYWENYGVHAMEGLYMLMGPGITSVVNLGDRRINVVYVEWGDGRKAVIENVYNSKVTGYDIITADGTHKIQDKNTFHMFKRQMEVFVKFMEDGEYPYPYQETVEITKVIVAGIKSREEKRKVKLSEI